MNAPKLAVLAAALEGDRGALETLAAEPGLFALIAPRRLAPAVCRRLQSLGISSCCEKEIGLQLRGSIAQRVTLEAELARVGDLLDRGGVEWAPIKGLGLPNGTYEQDYERPTSDIDILIHPRSLAVAREAITGGGFTPVHESPLQDRYLRDEGYAFLAKGRAGVLLELHFRLWGCVPEALGAEMLGRAAATDLEGSCRRSLRHADSYLLTAVHTWLAPPEQRFRYWWELHRIQRCCGEAARDEIVREARRWNLQLFIALSARIATDFWPDVHHGRIGELMMAELRWSERRVLKRAVRRDPEQLPLTEIVGARLWARRGARMGLRTILRRVWPHPGVVERETPCNLPWWHRRLIATRRALGW